MSEKLKVVELRKELAARGLDATGNKPALVERLDEAIREDEEKEQKKKQLAESKKRKATGDLDSALDGDGKVPMSNKLLVVDLRKELANRGLDTTGTKPILVDRLDAAIAQEAKTSSGNGRTGKKDDAKKDKADGALQGQNGKFVTAVKKGSAVLDKCLPDRIKADYHVLHIGDDIYDAMLNQTNVGDNNNKFYVIQALESSDRRCFHVYNRWGRVGVQGQEQLLGPYQSSSEAVAEFKSKFYNKTKNHWEDRHQFMTYKKLYTWLEMDYSENVDKEAEKPPVTNAGPQSDVTKLDRRVAQFVSLICDVSMMKQQMLEIGYNAEKLPLGKLSKSTILKGYEVLKRISEVIQKSSRKDLEELSGEFYTVIPHDFGFRKMCEFVIDTPQKLKQKLEMVEALGEIELATKLLKDDSEEQDDPLYHQYQRLQCHLTPLDAYSEEYDTINQYLKNTHASTHSGFTVDIVHIFKVSREREDMRFKKFSSMKNRMLLWHGSRLTNWTGILSQGLRIAPPEAPVTGYMFGKGVYFADMFSKSANYCYASKAARCGVLLLCEVALGEMAELLNANYTANELPPGKLSTKGCGKTAPEPKEYKVLEDGVQVPFGKPKSTGSKGSLLYNEYIVYNVEQIRMRYVLQVQFNYRH